MPTAILAVLLMPDESAWGDDVEAEPAGVVVAALAAPVLEADCFAVAAAEEEAAIKLWGNMLK